MENMKLSELKAKSPAELLEFAESYEIENASTMRKQELMFAILKELAAREVDITGEGVVEVLPDGFGFLRSPDANYLPGPDDIYVSPSQIRRFSLRTGDTVEGQIRSLKEGERYFTLLKVNTINFEDPEGPPQGQLRQPDPLHPTSGWLSHGPTVRTERAGRGPCRPARQGQRALIMAPPRTGRTVLLQNIAQSIAINFWMLPNWRLSTNVEIRRALSAKGEVISSTFDEPASGIQSQG